MTDEVKFAYDDDRPLTLDLCHARGFVGGLYALVYAVPPLAIVLSHTRLGFTARIAPMSNLSSEKRRELGLVDEISYNSNWPRKLRTAGELERLLFAMSGST